jgi:hypothetical protein
MSRPTDAARTKTPAGKAEIRAAARALGADVERIERESAKAKRRAERKGQAD